MGRRIALIVGVGEYKSLTGLSRLESPVNDAQSVYEVLSKYGNFDTLYPLPLSHNKLGSSGVVSSDELVSKLKELLNPEEKDEVELAVLYFSGHGVCEREQVMYLASSDQRYAIALPWLANLAKNSAAKNICLWLDCCHSGDILKFSDIDDKGFCVVAASSGSGEALAINGRSLLTNILCEALTPCYQNKSEVRVLDFIQSIERRRKNMPQHILCLRGNVSFTLTSENEVVSIESEYPEDHPPYKGLLSFKEKDRDFFFGRDNFIQKLLDKLKFTSFIPIIGSSGSGKSSLVFAGLIPSLFDKEWKLLHISRLSEEPIQSLRDSFVRAYPSENILPTQDYPEFNKDVISLISDKKKVLLVIDQFEEIFSESISEENRHKFIRFLIESIKIKKTLHIIITMRSDFIDQSMKYDFLGEIIQNNSLFLSNLSSEELRRSIINPLKLVGMSIESKLVDELVSECFNENGSLPLLQYVLDQLWTEARAAEKKYIDWSLYKKISNHEAASLSKILNKKADEFYDKLSENKKDILEWIMLELIQPSGNNNYVRKTINVNELYDNQPNYKSEISQLLDLLVTKERLIVKDSDCEKNAVLTISHESLIKDWGKLKEWIIKSNETRSWLSRIRSDITYWEKFGDTLSYGAKLSEAISMIKGKASSLLINEKDRKFVRESIVNNNKKEIAKNKIIFQSFREKSRSSFLDWKENKKSESFMCHVLCLLESEKYLSGIPISKELFNYDGEFFATEVTRTSIRYGGFFSATKFFLSYDFISGSSSGDLIFWNLENGRIKYSLNIHKESINHILMVEKRKYLITASSDKSISILDVNKMKVSSVLIGHRESVSALGYIESCDVIISGTTKGVIGFWDATSGKCLNITDNFGGYKAGFPGGIYSISYDENYQNIAVGYKNNEGSISQIKILKINDYDSIYEVCKLKDLPRGKNSVHELFFDSTGDYLFGVEGLLITRKWSLKENTIVKCELLYKIGDEFFDGDILKNEFFKKISTLWDDSYKFLKIPKGHGSAVEKVSHSPDGLLVVTASSDGSIKVWNGNSGKEIKSLFVGRKPINLLSYSPTENVIVFLCEIDLKFSLVKMDVSTGKKINAFDFGFHSSHKLIDYSLCGNFILLANDFEFVLFKSNSLQIVKSFRVLDMDHLKFVNADPTNADLRERISLKYKITSITFNSNSNIIICGLSGGGMEVFSLDATCKFDKPITIEHIGSLGGHSAEVTSLASSPNNPEIIASGSEDRTIVLWNIFDMKKTSYFVGPSGKIKDLIYTSTGLIIASGYIDNCIWFWDCTTKKLLHVSKQNKEIINSLSYSEKNNSLVSGSQKGLIKFWNIKKEPNNNFFERDNENYCNFTISPCGKKIVESHNENIHVLDFFTNKELLTLKKHKDEITALSYSSDGLTIASGSKDNRLIIWDAINGSIVRELEWCFVNQYELVYRPDGAAIAFSQTYYHTMDQLDIRNFSRLASSRIDIECRMESLCYSQDSRLIATGLQDGSIAIWDTGDGKLIKTLRGHTGSIIKVTFSTDGKSIASSSSDKSIRIWDFQEGLTVEVIHTNSTSQAITYSPDGKLLITGSDDNKIRVWDVESYDLLRTIESHSSPVKKIQCTPDSNIVVSSSLDGKLIAYNLITPIEKLLSRFEPAKVAEILSFIWEVELDGLELKYKPNSELLFDQFGYYIDFDKIGHNYRYLLDPPRNNSTKLEQVVDFLEKSI